MLVPVADNKLEETGNSKHKCQHQYDDTKSRHTAAIRTPISCDCMRSQYCSSVQILTVVVVRLGGALLGGRSVPTWLESIHTHAVSSQITSAVRIAVLALGVVCAFPAQGRSWMAAELRRDESLLADALAPYAEQVEGIVAIVVVIASVAEPLYAVICIRVIDGIKQRYGDDDEQPS